MDLVWEKLDSSTLVWGGNWEDVKSSVRAKTFGKMLELARDRVQFYIGDLFHDALWIEQNLNGPRQFDWLVREGGTFIGETVLHIKMDEWVGVFKYRFDVREDNGKWTLDVYQAVETRPNVPDAVQIVLPGESLKREWTVDELMGGPEINVPGVNQSANFPTRRNKIEEPKMARRKDSGTMLDEIISSIQEKLEELENARQEAENAKEELDTFLSDSEDALTEYAEAIRMIERISLPDVSVNVKVDVEFEA